MEIEIQGIPQSVRATYASRVKNAKSELARYKKRAKDTHAAVSRGELLGARGSGSQASLASHTLILTISSNPTLPYLHSCDAIR
jgi:hypothetical protein